MVSKEKYRQGTITPALLIIASAFIIAIYGLLFILSLQFDYSNRQIASEKAVNIAEAGINYYQWHLIKSPGDYQDGTEDPDGPYIHDYTDPQGDVIGQFSLSITPPSQASSIVTISSTGYTNQYPKIKRTIVAKYGKVSLTAFAFVHNSNLWFGKSITVNGPVFSNGGIRMDGTNTSTVQSAKQTYICGVESGCDEDGEEKPGIWGTGDDETLWEFPVPPIDFAGIYVNFSQMQGAAESEGLYLPPSGDQGYQIIFNSDGTFNLYEVTGVDYIKGYTPEVGCQDLYQVILDKVLVGTYNVSDTPIIFVEDTLWIEGTLKGEITVAAARFPLGSYTTYIYIPNNLIYLAKDGTNSLGLIGRDDIIMTRDVPDYYEINGALLAQQGRIIRHHYGIQGCKSSGSDKNKNEFIFYGSMISKDRSYWNFSSGPGVPASGFVKSTLTFDPDMANDPPSYFPATQYQLISWKEE